MRVIWRAAFCLSLVAVGCISATAQTKSGAQAVSLATQFGLPERVGVWRLVRYVSGEHAHFLYANDKRTFSLFVTETKNNRPLQPQTGWKRVDLGSGGSAFLHQDPRHSERNAIAFKRQTQRRLVVGRLTETELIEVTKQLK